MTPPTSPVPMALCVGRWLPYSETFVRDQLERQQRFRASVLALGRERRESYRYHPIVALGRIEELRYRYAGSSPTFLRALRESRSRLVHAHFGTHGALVLPLARALDLPLVVSFHGHDVGGLLPKNRRTLRYGGYQRAAPRLFAQASLLLCASTELATLLEAAGAPARKIVVHRLGIDLDRFSDDGSRARTDVPTLLVVGRLVEKKGVSDAIHALARLRRHHPDACLRVVGDGPLRRVLARRARWLGVARAVTFLGALSPERVRDEMRRAHVLLAPSVVTPRGDRDSGLLVVKEAAACGLPAVATRHGGIPEIVDDGETGFLVPERSPASIAGRTRLLLDDPGLGARMGRAARARMERDYDAAVRHRTLEELLASVL